MPQCDDPRPFDRYTRTFHSEGIVRAAGPGWLDVEFPGEYVCDLSDGCLRFLDDEGTAYPFSSLLEFDAVKREPAFHVDDYWLAKHTIVARQQPGGLVRIFRDDLKAGIGNIMVFGAARRLNPGFTISDSEGHRDPRRKPLPLRGHGGNRAA